MTNSKNLTIVFITNNWLPFGAGVVSSINAFREELLKQGHRVVVITLDFKRSSSEKEEGVIRISCPIKFLYRGIPMAIPWRADKQVRDLIKQLSPEIIHIHHPFLLGVSGLRAAKLYAIPCVFTYHSLYEKYAHYVPFPQMLVKPVIRQMVRRFCALVSGIITPGKETERLLERDGISTPHLLLPSPVQQVFVHMQVKNQQKEIPNSEQKPFHLMTCSRFVKEKNIPFLLNMFAGLDQTKFRFTLAGFGSELDALKHYAYETLKLSPDIVQFAVKLSAQYLCQLYAECDLFVFASLADTQGLVLAEAMTNGLPVVALNGPGQEDIVVNGENGYLVSSVEEMCVAVQLIANDSAVHENLRQGALQTASRYGPTSLTEQLIAFYYSLIHKE